MKLQLGTLALAAFVAGASASAARAQSQTPGAVVASDDPFIWLEQVSSTRSMDWVHAENAKTVAVLEHDPHYASLYAEAVKL